MPQEMNGDTAAPETAPSPEPAAPEPQTAPEPDVAPAPEAEPEAVVEPVVEEKQPEAEPAKAKPEVHSIV